ncbi:hypothetical protein C805_00015 [Eubacterium sp. 14-2]|uniref:hypothetical protein n=1 Tax=Eubacterium sp. 14-2 TaxID=1235790 RepID=UPI00033B46CF|nr:hypothetical protein [Eubacterium sp. 14-2]EOT29432.1 hypothetical protein C805_00015 [Eubacterium sp. 14-2]
MTKKQLKELPALLSGLSFTEWKIVEHIVDMEFSEERIRIEFEEIRRIMKRIESKIELEEEN